MEEVYNSDEFRMYAYKIKQCPRTRTHDWTDCPYAHRGEKAQRRDPRKVDYAAVACPAFRGGSCLTGATCPYAHGVFEYWLHPARYRTRACNAGEFCRRKVCFFAHSPDQLRLEPTAKKRWLLCSGRGGAGASNNSACKGASGGGSGAAESSPSARTKESEEEVEDDVEVVNAGTLDALVLDLSHLGWV